MTQPAWKTPATPAERIGLVLLVLAAALVAGSVLLLAGGAVWSIVTMLLGFIGDIWASAITHPPFGHVIFGWAFRIVFAALLACLSLLALGDLLGWSRKA